MAAGDSSDAVPLDDRGLLLGDGLFETLLFTPLAAAAQRAMASNDIARFQFPLTFATPRTQPGGER